MTHSPTAEPRGPAAVDSASTADTPSSKETGRPRVCIPVNGVHTEALVDSGASYTLLSRVLYDRLPRLTPLSMAPRLVSITGHEIPTQGVCTVKIASLAMQVVVCQNLDVSLLIGADMLQHCILDFPAKRITIGLKNSP